MQGDEAVLVQELDSTAAAFEKTTEQNGCGNICCVVSSEPEKVFCTLYSLLTCQRVCCNS